MLCGTVRSTEYAGENKNCHGPWFFPYRLCSHVVYRSRLPVHLSISNPSLIIVFSKKVTLGPERTLYVPDLTQGIRGTWWLKAGHYPGGHTPSARGSFHLFPAVNLETWLQNVILTAAMSPPPHRGRLDDVASVGFPPPPMQDHDHDASSSREDQGPSAPLVESYHDLERGRGANSGGNDSGGE